MLLDDPARLEVMDAALFRADDRDILDIVVRAAGVAAMPIAAFSIVLERTQLYRAHLGLPSAIGKMAAIAIERSPCIEVIRGELPVMVPDAACEAAPAALFADCAVRAYVGVPVRHRGAVVGTLAVLDPAPRRLSPRLVERLGGLASEVSAALALRQPDRRGVLDTLPDPDVVEAVVHELAHDLANAAGRLVDALSSTGSWRTDEHARWLALLDCGTEALLSHEELTDAASRLAQTVCRLRPDRGAHGRAIAAALARVHRVALEIQPRLRLVQAGRAGLVDAHLGARSLRLLPSREILERRLLASTAEVLAGSKELRRQGGSESRVAG